MIDGLTWEPRDDGEVLLGSAFMATVFHWRGEWHSGVFSTGDKCVELAHGTSATAEAAREWAEGWIATKGRQS